MKPIISILFILIISNLNAQSYNTITEKYVTVNFEQSFDKRVGKISLYTKRTIPKIKTRKKVSTITIVRIILENTSCVDIRYNTPIKIRIDNKVSTYQYNGIIKANSELVLSTFTPKINFRLVDFKEDFKRLYSNGEVIIYGNINIESLLMDSKLFKCLGFNSKEEAQIYANKQIEKRRKESEEYKKKKIIEAEKKKIEKKEKEQLWKESGIDKHIAHYSKTKENGFYKNVPYDIIENIAKHSNKPLFIINLGAYRYKKGLLKLTTENISFLNEKVIALIENNSNREFWNWVKLKKLNIKSTPVLIIMDTKGNIQFTDVKFNRDIRKNVSPLLTDLATKIK